MKDRPHGPPVPPLAAEEVERTHPATGRLRVFSLTQHLARSVFVSFVVTFIAARANVLLSSMGIIPNIYLQLGETHVHHLNFGIALLALVGGFLLFVRPGGRWLRVAGVIYGVALGLTFDEFGMWLHLEDVYWQRASFDAVVLIAALLGLVVAAPTMRRFRRRHWVTLAGLAVAVTLFGVLVLRPMWGRG